jgi:hypothetical protein
MLGEREGDRVTAGGGARATFDGWRIVALAAVCQALGFGLLSGYGFLVAPLAAEFGATTTHLGFGFSISVLFTALTGPALGRFLDTGPLKPIMLGGVAGLHALLGLPFLLTVAPLVGLVEQRTGSFVLPFLGLAGTLLVAALVLASVRIPEVEPGL